MNSTVETTPLAKQQSRAGASGVPPQIVPRAHAPRLRALDGLRLIAALMVAFYHYGGRGGKVSQAWGTSPSVQFPTMHEYFSYGSLGVHIFFIISGFVICMSGWGRSLRSFFASRASRLLPSYWLAVILVAGVFALPVVAYKSVSPSDALLNLSMLQYPMGVDRVLGVCWTLWVEVRFYALFALCIVIPGATRQRVITFCAVWTLAAVIARGAEQPLLDIIVMPKYAPFFIGGIGLYLIHRDRKDTYAWGIVAVSWLIGQNIAFHSMWHPPGADVFAHRTTFGILLIVTLGFLAVAAIALGWLNWANWRWLSLAGALTYPFYLIHEHLGWVVIWYFHRHLGIPSLATFALTLGTMLVLAWVMYRGVEQRLQPVLRKVLERPRA
ncbi:acyltransferase family protein [Streptomyces sp. NPDC002845]